MAYHSFDCESDGKLSRRHLNDVKDATQVTEEEETCLVDYNTLPAGNPPLRLPQDLENHLPPNNLAMNPPNPPAAAEGRPQREKKTSRTIQERVMGDGMKE